MLTAVELSDESLRLIIRVIRERNELRERCEYLEREVEQLERLLTIMGRHVKL